MEGKEEVLDKALEEILYYQALTLQHVPPHEATYNNNSVLCKLRISLFTSAHPCCPEVVYLEVLANLGKYVLRRLSSYSLKVA